MTDALHKPQVVVNGEVVFIVPNSLKHKDGFGTRNTRVASGGGERREIINTEDITTQFGELTFDMYATVENINLKRQWQANFDANEVGWLEAGESRTMTNALIQEDPEVNSGVDGQFTVMFKGDRLT
ncbi:MAG: hypothetical protein PVJ86_01410 [Phycisphaerales bacterium]|jgi:hypothetical protein